MAGRQRRRRHGPHRPGGDPMAQLQAVGPISDEDRNALPGQDIGPAAALPANSQPKLVIPAGGSGRLFRVEYPPSTAADGLQGGVTYTLWVPEGAAHLRGVIVHQHGSGTTAARERATAAYDLHWQALARS